MKSKFLFFVVIIVALALNVTAENISVGVQEYYKTEGNLSNISAEIDTLNNTIGELEQEIALRNDEEDTLESVIMEKNTEIIDLENKIKNTKNDVSNLKNKKSEFDVNKGLGYKIGNMLIPFAIGLWISIIILIFVWRGE